jgi:ribonuclease-3
VEEEGPDHAKQFTARVIFQGRSWGSGAGSSKKEAEQSAAADAFAALQPDGPGPLEREAAGEADTAASHAESSSVPSQSADDI